MRPVEVVEALAATSSKLEKERIVKQAWAAKCYEFFEGARLAYDSFTTFGVAKVPAVQEDEPVDLEHPLSFTQFKALADKLAKRELTGNAARKAIQDCALEADAKDWNLWYKNILLKDLKCGTTDSTINSVLEEIAKVDKSAEDYIIYVFECQLATDGLKHPKKMKGQKYLDVKLDGVRLLIALDKEKGEVTAYTRNGKVNENFPQITEALKSMLDRIDASLMLDGEIVAANFQELMTQINRKSKVNTDNAKLALFDILPLEDFHKGKCDLKQSERHKLLVNYIPMFQELTGERVYVVPKRLVDLDSEQGYKEYLEFNKEAVDAGFEGIMIKDPNAPYECKRSTHWLKQKPFIEVTLEIVGFNPGEPDTKYAHTLGALVCHGFSDDGREIDVKVSGLDDEMRDEFWNNRDKYMGFLVEVRADALTKERNSTTWSMRFPRFKGLRGTKPGEKI